MRGSIIYPLFTFLFVFSSKAITHISLNANFPEEKKNEYLLSLKFLQKNLASPSFLEEIPLHQQVIAQKRLATYYGDIGVGIGVGDEKNKTQNFKMLFDTGSCEFWIPSEKCTTKRCLTHQRYKRSNTYEFYNGAAMSIQYLSGKVQGEMAKETIRLGDLDVPHQIIGIAQEVEIPLLDEVTWDGILGLAYPNQNLKRQGIKPLFDDIMAQGLLTQKGEKNQFAYYLGAERGSISFGGADMRYKRSIDEEFVWAPIAEESYWTISLTDVRKVYASEKESTKSSGFLQMDNNNIKLCPKGCKAIVDTGTYLIYGPSEQVQGYLGDLAIDSCEKKKDLPNLVFEFLGEKSENGQQLYVELTLTPDDYVLQFQINGVDDCVIGIGPDNEDTGWTVGQVFLKAFYSVFDRDNNRIGFVRANPNPNPPPGELHRTEITDVKFISTTTPDETKPLETTGKSETGVGVGETLDQKIDDTKFTATNQLVSEQNYFNLDNSNLLSLNPSANGSIKNKIKVEKSKLQLESSVNQEPPTSKPSNNIQNNVSNEGLKNGALPSFDNEIFTNNLYINSFP